MRFLDRRKLIWAVLALLIAVLTILAVFSQSKSLSPATLALTLRSASPAWIGLAFLGMAGFIVFEGLALICILRGLGYREDLLRGLLYSAGDLYFSAITPSASGGQPASAFFMGANGIPAAAITVTLMLNMVMYTLAAFSVGMVCFALRPSVFFGFGLWSRLLIGIGMTVLAGLTLFFCGLLKRGRVLYVLGSRLISFLGKLGLLRRPERKRRKLEKLVEEFGICARAVAGKRQILVVAYVLNLAQRLSQVSVTAALYYALGGTSPVEAIELLMIQSYSQIGSYSVPIPGGMGAIDYLMLDGFRSLFQTDYACQLQLISRGISFYICTLLSGLIVLAGVVLIHQRKPKKDNRIKSLR